MEFTFKSIADLHEFLSLIASAIKIAWSRKRPLYCLRGDGRQVFLDVQTEGVPVARCDLSDHVVEFIDGELGWFDLTRLVELLALLRREASVRFVPRDSDLDVVSERNRATFRRVGGGPIARWPEPSGRADLSVAAGDFATLARFVRAGEGEEAKVRLMGGDGEGTVEVYGYSPAKLIHGVMSGAGRGVIDLFAQSVVAAGQLSRLAKDIYLRQAELGGICIADVPPHRFFLPTVFVHDSVLAMARDYVAQSVALPACVCDARAFAAAAESLAGDGMVTLATFERQLVLECHDETYRAHAVVPHDGAELTTKIQVDYNALLRFARAFNANTSDLYIKFGYGPRSFLCMQNGTGTLSVFIAAARG